MSMLPAAISCSSGFQICVRERSTSDGRLLAPAELVAGRCRKLESARAAADVMM